ncbi:hypothetical protein QQP08_017737 [Theobroma cacao]|nr:hypothetical protein QQP08_017737 [Theobroma cacao]
MSSTPVCYLTSCQAWDAYLQYPEDSFWPSRMLEINVKATFVACEKTQGGGGGKKLLDDVQLGGRRVVVQEESHGLILDQLLNNVVGKDWHGTNIWDVFDSMQIPIQRPVLDEIVGCALAMAANECYENCKVLRMRVEIETLVDDDDQLMNFEEDQDVYSIDVEEDDFWETVEAFRTLRKVVVAEDNPPENLCSICLGEFLVGSDISATPCSHVCSSGNWKINHIPSKDKDMADALAKAGVLGKAEREVAAMMIAMCFGCKLAMGMQLVTGLCQADEKSY